MRDTFIVSTPSLRVVVRIAAAMILASFGLLGADVQPLLTAPVADSEIRIRLSASGKAVQWDIPETKIDFQSLTDGKVFLTRDAVKITYAAFNPLRISVTASSKRSQSPDASVLSDLMTSILAVPSTAAPDSSGLADLVKSRSVGVEALRFKTPVNLGICSDLDEDLAKLREKLNADEFTAKALGAQVKNWSDTVDDAFKPPAGGPDAMKAGSAAIRASLDKQLRPILKDAQDAWERIVACANVNVDIPAEVNVAPEPGAEPTVPPGLDAEPSPVPVPAATASDAERTKYQNYLEVYAAYVKRLQGKVTHLAWQQRVDASTQYEQYVVKKDQSETLAMSKRDASQVVVLQGILDPMKSIISSAESLASALDGYAKPANWFDGYSADFLLLPSELKPTAEEMETVTVEISAVTYDLDKVKNVIAAKSSSAAKVSFDVRWYSRFVIEPSVGAVFGTVTQAEYGTATNAAGQTVLAKLPSKSVPVAPSVMVNLVCRCGPSLLTPMVQIGAATSKTVPAVLLGGGIRIPGASGFAIGGGAMFAWTKDLQTLKVDQVVSGTAAIEADKGYWLTIGGYFTIQYKFGK